MRLPKYFHQGNRFTATSHCGCCPELGSAVRVSLLTGGHWQKQKVGSRSQLVGHIHMSDTVANQLFEHSGKQGLIFKKLSKAGAEGPRPDNFLGPKEQGRRSRDLFEALLVHAASEKSTNDFPLWRGKRHRFLLRWSGKNLRCCPERGLGTHGAGGCERIFRRLQLLRAVRDFWFMTTPNGMS